MELEVAFGKGMDERYERMLNLMGLGQFRGNHYFDQLGMPVNIPVAWFSVDNGDSEPFHFLTNCYSGLQVLAANTGK